MSVQAASRSFAEWNGFCPICNAPTRFVAEQSWFRDHLFCHSCVNGSIPRERAIMSVINGVVPDWRNLSIHEGSPGGRGASVLLAQQCKNYTPSQFFPNVPLGEVHNGASCQNLEAQTFPDEAFDLVVTMDVMEHVFHPDAAHREIWRTLRPGGMHIHTTPIYKDILETRVVATIDNGKVTHLEPPEYHGNPVDAQGSLVTVRYGYDIIDLIPKWAPFDVEIRRFNSKALGIVGEFTEVIICRKPS